MKMTERTKIVKTQIYVSFDEPAVRQLERQAWEEGITIPAAVERDTVRYLLSKKQTKQGKAKND